MSDGNKYTLLVVDQQDIWTVCLENVEMIKLHSGCCGNQAIYVSCAGDWEN